MAVMTLVLILGGCEAGSPARIEAPADSASGEVSFTMAGPNESAMLIPVRINGREAVDFIVDTGATLTCIDVSLARELGLPDEDEVGGVALGVATVGRMRTVRMDTLRVGHAAAFDIAACKIDLEHLRRALGAQGLLGLNFLRSFDVAIDFDRNIMTLRNAELP
jgi:predicted aspartyl protease